MNMNTHEEQFQKISQTSAFRSKRIDNGTETNETEFNVLQRHWNRGEKG